MQRENLPHVNPLRDRTAWRAVSFATITRAIRLGWTWTEPRRPWRGLVLRSPGGVDWHVQTRPRFAMRRAVELPALVAFFPDAA